MCLNECFAYCYNTASANIHQNHILIDTYHSEMVNLYNDSLSSRLMYHMIYSYNMAILSHWIFNSPNATGENMHQVSMLNTNYSTKRVKSLTCRLLLLGADLVLLSDGGVRPRAHLPQRRQDLHHLRAPAQLVCEPLLVRHIHQAVQEGLHTDL